jgi:hypothetical protein
MRRLISAIAISLLVLTVALQVRAQDEATPEEQAVIKPGEMGHLDRGSILAYGPLTRFEASVAWDEAGGPRPTGYKSRKVRYVADCKAGTLTLAGVGVFDSEGKVVKTTVVPPGASDAVTPKSDSSEARWLKEACAE